jgi:Tol biopolymer transport system component
MNKPTVTLASGALAVACMLALAVPAQASFPGRNGSIAFSSLRHGSYDIYLVSTSGKFTRLTKTSKINETSPAWSANGKKIAYERRDFSDQNHPGPFEIWVMNADGSHRQRVTKGTEPAWSPNGKKIAYVGPRQPRVSKPDIYVINSDGTHKKQLTKDRKSERSPDWSPDGKWIAFATDRGSSHDVWKMHPDGTHGIRLTSVGFYDDQPSWAPNGKKIAYISRRVSGPFHLWTMNADGSGATEVGDLRVAAVAWSPDGRQIAYQQSDLQGAGLDIFRVGLSGSNPINLTHNPAPDTGPSWQPR